MRSQKKFHLYLSIVFLGLLSQCNRADKDLEDLATREHRTPKTKLEREKEKTKGYIFGEPLLSLGSKKAEETNIGVNSYLWRAALDVASSLPKVKADPFGGVVITDWHIADTAPTERLKMEIIIIGRQLRSDAIRVSVFRQELKGKQWVDAPVSHHVLDQIEETIIKRARDIRIQEEK
jgi:hypothetical protein